MPLWLALLAAVGLLAYTTLRAASVSMTHDECGSFLIWLDFPIFTCHADPNCWGSANLHFLYVLLMKGSVQLFGNSELAIRLPALLGHVVYMVCSWKLVRSWAPNKGWLALFGFVILNFNPFMLEFFALARGYGLGVSMSMVGLYFMSRYFQTGKTGMLAAALGGGFLAAMANFTFLLFFAAQLCVWAGNWLLLFFLRKKTGPLASQPEAAPTAANGLGLHRPASFFPQLLVVAGVSALLAWLVLPPIRLLSQNGEFEWGAGSFYDTFITSMRVTLYGGKYFHGHNAELLGGILVALLLAAGWFSVKSLWRNPGGVGERFFLAAVLFPLLVSGATIVQHQLLGSQYLVNRTTLILFPLCILPIFLLFAEVLKQKTTRLRILPPLLIALFCVVHLFRVGLKDYSSEWYYDAGTKQMLFYLHDKLPPGQKVKLGLHWLYHPSSSFYFKTVPFDFAAEPLVYSKSLRRDDYYDYYYVQPSDIDSLPKNYIMEKNFMGVGCLMRRQ